MQGPRQSTLTGKVQGEFLTPAEPNEWGILVLGGSSGRVDVRRASLFADLGLTALALRWFGGKDQTPGVCEVPLETFVDGIDELHRHGCKRIAIIGTSKGAEAALLTASLDERVQAVFAISPSSVVWGNIGPGLDGVSWPERSSWSWKGEPLPFVPADPFWQKEYHQALVVYRGLFEHCLRKFASSVPAAAIPVEDTRADVIVIAGGRDALWPSDLFAREIVERRRQFGMDTKLVCDPDAGHRVLLPGESTPRSSLHAHGGDDEADARLGIAAWAVITKTLRAPPGIFPRHR
ncbi:acyl-CoA thioester hydrolase/BAAT C-terminal domain-containing protein [Rhizobium sp. BR 315]|uniref:acyl-CoA thioester hydrolase/BAAT C-terminal domain-containing protein n=1 Tax=Rhizobium sp. BR 315 TaxID=3040014 RepID=UPI003D34F9F1